MSAVVCVDCRVFPLFWHGLAEMPFTKLQKIQIWILDVKVNFCDLVSKEPTCKCTSYTLNQTVWDFEHINTILKRSEKHHLFHFKQCAAEVFRFHCKKLINPKALSRIPTIYFWMSMLCWRQWCMGQLSCHHSLFKCSTGGVRGREKHENQTQRFVLVYFSQWTGKQWFSLCTKAWGWMAWKDSSMLPFISPFSQYLSPTESFGFPLWLILTAITFSEHFFDN